MKVTRLLVPLMLMFALPTMAMTDQQVINYIKTQAAAGKSQTKIGQELLAKGVTPDQIKRIKARYESDSSDFDSKESSTSNSRLRQSTDKETKGTNNRKLSKKSQYLRNGAGYVDDYGMMDDYGMEYEDDLLTQGDLFIGLDTEDGTQKKIYGQDIFAARELSFEPNANMATPQDYRLGPGDEVIIDIWGASEDNLRAEISPDGKIVISQLGPVYLNGMTIAEANRHVKNIFAKKYAGVGTDTDINLTLGNYRSIQVDVMGEVRTPGSFRVSPFSNVFHAIYNAGGINDIGTLRDIKVMRKGKVIANVDFYDYIFKGKDTGNIRLQEGDVIIVPPYAELVNVEGNVKRPMYYELKPSESLAKLIEYAGGFAGDAYSDVVKIERLNGSDKMIFTVGKEQFPSYTLKDGDAVTIGAVTDKYSNKVELNGAVNRPGTYAMNDNISTIRQLINQADGLSENAYLNRALIYREKPDRSLEIISFNLGELMDGKIADIRLNRNDVIEIANLNEITERGALSIEGYVAKPGDYQFAEGTTVEDLVLQAGGLLEGASTARVEVARRIVDQNATDATSQIAQMFTFGIGDNSNSQYKDFVLKPYDVVHIRKSPTYQKQEFITLEGQVLFPGGYVLQSRNQRISDVVNRAGGLLESAYVKGAYLKRKMNKEQKQQQIEAMKSASREAAKNIKDTQLLAIQQQNDSIQLEKLEKEEFYSVGIDLEKALANPGSTFDFVVEGGDILIIPEIQTTVQISGEVLFPNTVTYVPGKNLKYYVEQAGGYGEEAKKSKAYVVYMNGSVAKGKRSTIIEPGCHIIVPTKKGGKFDWTPIFSITSTLGSLATLTATVVALTK